jgi:hypothetical protein
MDEWHHRESIGRMLPLLGVSPSAFREALFTAIGKSLRFLCPWSGWTLPMLCAGVIETMNVGQYVRMSRYATELGLVEMAAELDVMAEVERMHESFFFSALARRHPMLPVARKGQDRQYDRRLNARAIVGMSMRRPRYSQTARTSSL